MKTLMKSVLLLLFVCGVVQVLAQNVSTRTNEFEVDFSDPTKLVTTTIPVINWVTPTAETNFAGEARYKIKFEIESATPLKNISIIIEENPESASRGMQSITPSTEAEKFKSVIERNITLMDGQNVVEIVAENADGTKTISQRTIT